ncbi:MAG: hypothetical protein ABI654_09940 [Betaproteobacteria bacterium]
MRRKAGAQQAETELRAKEGADSKPQGAAASPVAESCASCGVASGLMRMLGMDEKKETREMTLAEIRKTYETGSSELPGTGATTVHPAALEKAKSA